MAESSIEWVSGPNGEPGYTFNPVRGCMKVSAECTHCYAETRDKRFEGGEHWGPNSRRVVASEALWRQPLKWNREAAAAGQRRKVFCASLADVMEDHPDWVEPRKRLFALIVDTPHLDWLLLTKRPENFHRFLPWGGLQGSIGWGSQWPNVWLGVTAGTEEMADKRVAILSATPAVCRFVSVEPMLEHTNPLACTDCGYKRSDQSFYGDHHLCGSQLPQVDWVICGGESGHGARALDLKWARFLRDQCKEAGVAFFFKQLGVHTRMTIADVSPGAPNAAEEVTMFFTKAQAGDLSVIPADLRIRQFPEVRR